jgi:hypothetical protein
MKFTLVLLLLVASSEAFNFLGKPKTPAAPAAAPPEQPVKKKGYPKPVRCRPDQINGEEENNRNHLMRSSMRVMNKARSTFHYALAFLTAH